MIDAVSIRRLHFLFGQEFLCPIIKRETLGNRAGKWDFSGRCLHLAGYTLPDMDSWHLALLGTPYATLGQTPVERLPTRNLWALLASLAIDPIAPSRSVLTERFWPTNLDPAQRLRSGLSAIRKAFQPELVMADLKLTPGTTCDLWELRALIKRAERLTTSEEKLPLLQEASWLIRGPFLDGCESENIPDWVTGTRSVVHGECISALSLLLQCQQALGDKKGVNDTLQRLLFFDPESPTLQAALLTMGQPLVDHLRKNSSWEEAEHNLTTPYLSRADKATLETLLTAQVQRLPSAFLPVLSALTVFPGSFTAQQAEGIALASPRELERFRQALLLQPEGDGRFFMREPIRQLLWRKLTGEQRRRLQERYGQWFVQWTNTQVEDVIRAPVREKAMAELTARLTEEARHLERAMTWVIQQPVSVSGALFLANLWGRCPAVRSAVEREKTYLGQYLSQGVIEENYHTFLSVLQVRASLCEVSAKGDYIQKFFDEVFHTDRHLTDYGLKVCCLDQWMVNCHHQGDDALFDQLTEIYRSLIPPTPEKKLTVSILAENLLARRRFAEALEANQEHWEYFVSKQPPKYHAHTFYLRGCIYHGMKNHEEARRAWNQALERFEDPFDPHGVAQCLESLGGLSLEAGMLAEARRLVLQAIELYKESDDDAAVCAASGTLGDILKERGDHDQARELYQRGLTFWQERDHPRWIKRFETRLQNL